MINSIGLPTKGIEYFLEHQLPEYKRFTPPLVCQHHRGDAPRISRRWRATSACPRST